MKKLSVLGVCAIGLTLTACGNVHEKLSSMKLASVAAQCASDSWQPTFADEGRTLRLQVDHDASEAEFNGIQCVFAQLEMSEAVRSQVDSTSVAAGQRVAEENGLRYTWTFSGFSGFDMVVQVVG